MLYLLYAAGRIPASALTSDGAFEHFNIHVDERARYTALADVIATREVLHRLFASFDVDAGVASDDFKIRLPL